MAIRMKDGENEHGEQYFVTAKPSYYLGAFVLACVMYQKKLSEIQSRLVR